MREEISIKTLQDFMDECAAYADRKEAEAERAGKPEEPEDPQVLEKPLPYNLTVREKAFFRNISREFFATSERIAGTLIDDLEADKTFRAGAAMPFLRLWDYTKTAVDRMKGVFASFFETKWDAVLNSVILIETLYLGYSIYDRGREIADSAVEWIKGSPAYTYVLKPAAEALEKTAPPVLDAMGKAWDDLLAVWREFRLSQPVQEIKSIVARGVEYVFDKVLDVGNIWNLYLQMVRIGGLSQFYSILGWFGVHTDSEVENMLGTSMEGYTETIHSLNLHGRYAEAEEKMNELGKLIVDTRAADLDYGIRYRNSKDEMVNFIASENKHITTTLDALLDERRPNERGIMVNVGPREFPVSREELENQLNLYEFFREADFKDRQGVIDLLYKEYLQRFDNMKARIMRDAAFSNQGALSRSFAEVEQANLHTSLMGEGFGLYYAEWGNEGERSYAELGRFVRGHYDMDTEVDSLYLSFFSREGWRQITEAAILNIAEERDSLIDSGVSRGVAVKIVDSAGRKVVQNIINPPAAEGSADLNEAVHIMAMQDEQLERERAETLRLYGEVASLL